MAYTTEDPKELKCADLFCGAGGTSTGLVRAAKKMGYKIDLLAINHWQVAIATHSANYPWARHICENLDNVDPRKVVPGGYLDLLVASPECTFFSRARGGKPRSDQSRASAWHVLRWAEALYIENILIENVAEFQRWGPLDKEGKPVKKLEGQTFLAFIRALESLGYSVEWRVVNAADHGDPTTRKRLFIMARREKPVIWPEPTYARRDHKDLFRNVKPWRPAREIIDWSLQSESIFNRKKPLSPNTMRRIMKGLVKFSGLPFVIGQQSGAAPRVVDEPIPTIAGAGAISFVEPVVQEIEEDFVQEYRRRFVEPIKRIAADGDDPDALELEPFVLGHPRGKQHKEDNVQSVDTPLPTITATSSDMFLAEPYLVKFYGTSDAASVDEPMPTVTAQGGHLGVCEPFIITAGGPEGQGRNPQSVDEPLGTILTEDKHALVEADIQPLEPFLTVYHGASYEGGDRVHSVDDPMPVVATSNQYALCEPYLVACNHGSDANRAYPLEEPMPTVTSVDAWGIAQPFLVKYNGTGGPMSVEEPLDTVTGKDRFGLVLPLADGRRALVDIKFRMLQPHELAAAMSFPKDYIFEGKRDEKVKQIGNAVAGKTAEALITSLLS